MDEEYGQPEVRSRLPLILQAQEGFLPVDDGSTRPYRLSTITERTERTEPSPHWRSRQPFLSAGTPQTFPSSPTTSYGQVIDDELSLSGKSSRSVDPNLIPLSPSGSAIHRLSQYEAPPSDHSSISPRSTRPTSAHQQSEPTPSVEGLPDIPDYSSKSSNQAPLPIPPPSRTPKQIGSKLSMLASSRASSLSIRSESSRSSGTARAGSIKTFPALRPSAHSDRPPSSVGASVISRDLPPTPPNVVTQSLTSSLVGRAIQTAIELEAVDKEVTPKPTRPSSPPSFSTDTQYRSVTPTLKLFRTLDSSPAKVSEDTVPLPKLASGRPPSKLALLAQQKADANRGPKLPKTTTEYLTPIANGSSVTTAITTSYQSLYSLTDPSRPSMIPKLDVVPLQQSESLSPAGMKPSKLALKIKRAGEKHVRPVLAEEEITLPVSPIFQVKPTRTHKNDKDWKHREKSDMGATSSPVLVVDDTLNSRPRSHKRNHIKPPIPELSPSAFSFDDPSPDDVVLHARRGTTLGKQTLSSVSSPRMTTGTRKPSSPP